MLPDVAERTKEVVPVKHRSRVILPVVGDSQIRVTHDAHQIMDVWIVALGKRLELQHVPRQPRGNDCWTISACVLNFFLTISAGDFGTNVPLSDF